MAETILETIAAHTRRRVEEDRRRLPLELLRDQCGQEGQAGGRRFLNALQGRGLGLICEVKKASPSKGILSEDFPYLDVARDYQAAGADCISCLTEPKWFLGSDQVFGDIRAAVSIPMLRKDFTVDEYQIYQARLLGAEAVLLICALLDTRTIARYLELCGELGLSAVVEAHDETELASAVSAGASIIGVNNRNLKDFSVDFATAARLRERIPPEVLYVAESGVTGPMTHAIENSGISHTNYSYAILQGRNVANALTSIMTSTGTNRVIINSESEAFVNDAVRNLDMLVYRKFNVILYSPSKIRSFETIDVDNLHNLKTRVSTAYYIDYESPAVRRFLLEYRALYNTEPTQFSFQGYDLAYFFISMKTKFGKSWMEKVARLGNSAMMQTDFLFRESSDGGYINEGVRRIVYGPDYSVRIVRE